MQDPVRFPFDEKDFSVSKMNPLYLSELRFQDSKFTYVLRYVIL